MISCIWYNICAIWVISYDSDHMPHMICDILHVIYRDLIVGCRELKALVTDLNFSRHFRTDVE